MRELSLDEIKSIELDMLINFDRICRKNGIKYSITYGTLLGAIRHKGFIPWDDDIDVMMSRDEYEKFLKVWKDGKYKLMTSRKDCDFWPLFSRITDPRTHLDPPKICNHGVWVAVIPYDKIPDDEKICQKHLKRVRRGMRLFEAKRSNYPVNGSESLPKKMAIAALEFLLRFIPFYTLAKRVERIKTKYRKTDAKRVNPWISRIIVDASIFDEYVDVEFEELMVMAIKQCDYFLQYMYGDYMKLPPLEERVPKHGFTAFIDE